jgi:hypothetical protein
MQRKPPFNFFWAFIRFAAFIGVVAATVKLSQAFGWLFGGGQ